MPRWYRIIFKNNFSLLIHLHQLGLLPGTTVLDEAVTKTAQFTGIVEVLLDFGARLDVR